MDRDHSLLRIGMISVEIILIMPTYTYAAGSFPENDQSEGFNLCSEIASNLRIPKEIVGHCTSYNASIMPKGISKNEIAQRLSNYELTTTAEVVDHIFENRFPVVVVESNGESTRVALFTSRACTEDLGIDCVRCTYN